MRLLVVVASLVLLAPLTAQQPADAASPVELAERLRALAGREVLTEADAKVRDADVAAWLAAAGRTDLGDRAILRAVAGALRTDKTERERAAAELLPWFEQGGAFPEPELHEVAARAVLGVLLHRADAGDFATCREKLPLLLRIYGDHRSAYWLLGRRGRDHGSPDGNEFLQQAVIPALLGDATLDDADRVAVLRRLYQVTYTGPRPFAHVEGPGLDGARVRTADHAGKVLLVDYWATWCQPCLLAMPGVVAVWKKHRGDGFQVIGVSLDEEERRPKLEAKVKELGMDWPLLCDGKGWKSPLVVANKVSAVPATFLIDRKGNVRFTDLDGEELEKRVAELLAEK